MKKRHSHKERVLLVNITRLGDMLQATPTIAGLKRDNPNCHVTVLVEKQFEAICHCLPDIDEVVSIDLGMTVRSLARENEGIVDAYEYLSELVDRLRAKRFDYCLNMSSSAYTALLLRILNVGRYGGWTADEEGYRLIESDWAKLFASSVYHQNRQYNSLNLVDVFRASADVENHPNSLLMNVTQDDLESSQKLLAAANFTNSGPIVAVQAGASQAKRQWQPENFVKLVDILVKENNCRVVLIGSKKELDVISRIEQGCQSPNVFVAAGKTSIPQLGALLKQSQILITGDTGPMHMAVAVGTPVVAMFLASAFGFETGPYSEGNIVLQPVIGCGPCNPNKPCAGLECHFTIAPELIAWLTLRRLQSSLFEVPDNIADPAQVQVYRSTFDKFGFCDLEPLNSPRFDYMWPYRQAYRKMWLKDLGGFDVPVESAATKSKTDSSLKIVGFDGLTGLDEVVAQAQLGQQFLIELVGLIRDPNAKTTDLGRLNERLTEVDRQIEQLGFHYPYLGPLTRMFIFSKENMQGTDALELTRQMDQIYVDLIRRCGMLQAYFKG